jgi:hypothetical protein
MPTSDEGAYSFTLEPQVTWWTCGDHSKNAIRNWACVHFRRNDPTASLRVPFPNWDPIVGRRRRRRRFLSLPLPFPLPFPFPLSLSLSLSHSRYLSLTLSLSLFPYSCYLSLSCVHAPLSAVHSCVRTLVRIRQESYSGFACLLRLRW